MEIEKANVFSLCEECHMRLDPNGPGDVVLEHEHEDALTQARAAGMEWAAKQVNFSCNCPHSVMTADPTYDHGHAEWCPVALKVKFEHQAAATLAQRGT